jgi:hypothetical protein
VSILSYLSSDHDYLTGLKRGKIPSQQTSGMTNMLVHSTAGDVLINDIVQAHHFPPSSTTREPGKAQQGKIAIVGFFSPVFYPHFLGQPWQARREAEQNSRRF